MAAKLNSNSRNRIRRSLSRRDGYRCVDCHVSGKVQKLTIDHVVPVSKGGTNRLANLRFRCASCNARKADGPEPQWIGGS